DDQDTALLQPDVQVALYFARGRVHYYRSQLVDGVRAFAIASASARSPELRTLADLAHANAMFSQAEFARAAAICDQIERTALPEPLRHAVTILTANLLYAAGQDLGRASTLYRQVLCTETSSLW